MIATSKMALQKSVSVRGRAANYSYMGASNASEDNAVGDISDLEITRSFMTDSYKTCEWIRKFVDIISERVSQIDIFPRPLGLRYGTKESVKVSDSIKRRMEKIMRILIRPNSDNESMGILVKKIMKDVGIYDQAGIQVVWDNMRDGSRNNFRLFANVTGEEIFVNPKRNGTLPNRRAYLQLQNGSQEVAAWSKDEFLSFSKNRRAGYANGISPIETAATSIMSDLMAMNFNIKFFENNARPDFVFLFENLGFGKGDAALNRAKTWYMQNHQGKPNLPLFMGAEKGNVKLQDLKYSHKDMQFFEWESFLVARLLAIYMMPAMYGINTGDSKEKDLEFQDKQFKKDVLIPHVNMMLQVLNTGFIWNDSNLGFDDVYLTSTNLDVDDDKDQAEIDEVYLDRGVITINQVRNRLQMPPVSWGNLPFVPLNYAPYDTLVKYQQSKIKSNMQRAMSDKVDNNLKVEGADDVGKDAIDDFGWHSSHHLAGLYSALYPDEMDGNIAYMVSMNKAIPTGTEKIDPSEIKEVVDSLVKMREQFLTKEYSFGFNMHQSPMFKHANNSGLRWSNILKKS